MNNEKRREFSKVITSIVVGLFSAVAIGFIVFVCVEMHRLGDLSPVAYIGPSIVGLLASLLGFYMWRAKAKSQSDLEWEKTKQLTEFREKHPEYFTPGKVTSGDQYGMGSYYSGGTNDYFTDGGYG